MYNFREYTVQFKSLNSVYNKKRSTNLHSARLKPHCLNVSLSNYKGSTSMRMLWEWGAYHFHVKLSHKTTSNSPSTKLLWCIFMGWKSFYKILWERYWEELSLWLISTLYRSRLGGLGVDTLCIQVYTCSCYS